MGWKGREEKNNGKGVREKKKCGVSDLCGEKGRAAVKEKHGSSKTVLTVKLNEKN